MQSLETGDARRQLLGAEGVGMHRQTQRLRSGGEVREPRPAPLIDTPVELHKPGADAVGVGRDIGKPGVAAQILDILRRIFVRADQLNQRQRRVQLMLEVAQCLGFEAL